METKDLDEILSRSESEKDMYESYDEIEAESNIRDALTQKETRGQLLSKLTEGVETSKDYFLLREDGSKINYLNENSFLEWFIDDCSFDELSDDEKKNTLWLLDAFVFQNVGITQPLQEKIILFAEHGLKGESDEEGYIPWLALGIFQSLREQDDNFKLTDDQEKLILRASESTNPHVSVMAESMISSKDDFDDELEARKEEEDEKSDDFDDELEVGKGEEEDEEEDEDQDEDDFREKQRSSRTYSRITRRTEEKEGKREEVLDTSSEEDSVEEDFPQLDDPGIALSVYRSWLEGEKSRVNKGIKSAFKFRKKKAALKEIKKHLDILDDHYSDRISDRMDEFDNAWKEAISHIAKKKQLSPEECFMLAYESANDYESENDEDRENLEKAKADISTARIILDRLDNYRFLKKGLKGLLKKARVGTESYKEMAQFTAQVFYKVFKKEVGGRDRELDKIEISFLETLNTVLEETSPDVASENTARARF